MNKYGMVWVGLAWVISGVMATVAHGAAPVGSAYAGPNNIYGAHLLVHEGADGTRGDKHLRWARHLVGRWGYAKTLLGGIDKHTPGPDPTWIDYVNKCYELELIPYLRLAGHFVGKHWIKPEADAPGDYTSMAQAVKRVVEGIPRSDLCPLYVEIWNEPNLDVEWTGQTNHKEYAAFFVAVSKAIRSIGDDRIHILNGGLATSSEWARLLCEDHPDFINAFDLWSVHPYPMNRPPRFNQHDKTVKPTADLCIDAYVLELAELKKFGRDHVKVMISETGWDLGNKVYTESEGYPIIDEYNRSDYIMRAFRDYWPKWPEIVAVFPFEFCADGWQRFDWVHPDSDVNDDGSPTKPHYQYTVVASLAKPTDITGAINGTLTVDSLGIRLEGVTVRVGHRSFTSDPMGNFFFGKVDPGMYTVRFASEGFESAERTVEVSAGQNTVVDVALKATQRVTLRGVVRSGDDASPLAGATVTLTPGDGQAQTDEAGRYIIRNRIPARYTLSAQAPDRYTYETNDVRVVIGGRNQHDFVLGTLPKLPPKNTASNRSMEAGGGGGGQAWVALGFEPLTVDKEIMEQTPGFMAEDTAHTGRISQGLKLFPQETVIRQITHYNTVQPGTRYTGGIWVKTDIPAGAGSAWITFDATNNAGSTIGRIGPSRKISGTSNWTWLVLEGLAPAGSERLSLNLHTQGSKGTAYFDDAFIGTTE